MDDAKAGGAAVDKPCSAVHRWCKRQNEKAKCQRVQRAWISTCLISLPSSLAPTHRTDDTHCTPVIVLYWRNLVELAVSLLTPPLHLALSIQSGATENASVAR